MPGVTASATAARDAIRTQLWPLPTAAVVVAVLVGIALPRLDRRIDSGLPGSVTDYLFGGDPSAARTVLDSVASSMITVTSLTFSLTVVTLQLASSQFSPRLLRTFTRDLFVQATLALFLATFVYALTVLRSVRTSGDDGQQAFVPRLSVTVGFVLALASVLGLVFFLAHLARQIRVETMLGVVHTDASQATERILTDRADPGSGLSAGVETTAPADAVRIEVPKSGFLVQVDEPALLEAAVRADAIVLIDTPPGSSLVEGTPMARAWARAGASLPADTVTALRRAVRLAVMTGRERTATQDVAFGLRQLTDVANKALSPGINDPTTAVHALGHSAALLAQFAGKDLGPRVLRDPEDRVRVVLRQPSLADLLELAVAQPRRYGAADPAVLTRLLTLLREVAWIASPDQAHVVAGQLERLRTTVAGQDFDDTERDRLAELARFVEQALQRQWPQTETNT